MTTEIDTIDMDGIFHRLGLYPTSLKEKAQALKQVLSYSEYDGLTLYFGGGSTKHSGFSPDIRKAIKVSSTENIKTTISQLIEDEGFTPNPEEHKEITELEIEPVIKGDDLWATIIYFKYKDELCSFAEEGKNKIGSFIYPYYRIYCFRQEIEKLLFKQNPNNEVINKIVIKPSKKKASKKIHDRREEALKSFLKDQVSKLEFPKDYNFQDTYEALGSLTKDEIWKELEKYRPLLFRSGDKDFFRHQKTIIFKTGTGKNR